MKNFKVFAETDIVEMENHLDNINLALDAFHNIIDDKDVTKAYVVSNITGELLASYDKYEGYYDFGGGIKIELWYSPNIMEY